MKLTLNRKILTGFIVCALFLLGIAIISFKNSEKFIATNYWVNHTHQVLFEFEQILVYSVDAETGERGFVITGDKNYLEPYTSSKLNIREHLEKAKELTRDNATQQKNLREIESLLEIFTRHLEDCIEVRTTEGFSKAEKMVASGVGKRSLDELRSRIYAAKEIENTLLAQREKTSENDARSFILVFIVLLIVIVIVLAIVYFIINSNLKALKKAETESANRNWSLAGSGELTKNMQGNKAVVELAQLIITYLSNYLNAEVGALYLLENDDMHLKLAAGYALGKSKIDAPAIRVGEGVVGQSAAENKTTLLQDIPKKYFTVNTGFGEVALRDIIASPLVFEHKVIGIIELGSIAGFTDIQKQFLNIVLDNIAIGITSSQSREKMKELLEETQRQAEELESQQEELRQINEELQEKTELLEKSEAELKAQQEELQQSNEELEEKANLLEEQKERLENSKVDLENKAGELEVTSRYKSEFLANMSHELRTPLNSILILAQLLSENKANVLGPKEVEFASNIHNSGNDLLNLINEILDLSKVESGKMELDIVETSFDDILSDVSSMFTEVAKNKSIDFKIHIDETSHSTITTDKQRLEQILRNLLSNAFKFTGKDHSVTLTVAKIPAVESFKNKKLNSLSEVVAFAVSDTGIGIPEDKLGIIFEAFQQADGSTKRKYGGTGLGLSISRELANVLGGEIQLHSIEGKGSTFTLFLPIVFDPLNSSPVEGKVEVKENAKRKASEPKNLEQDEESPVHDDRNSIQEQDRVILIMEDDPGFARILLDFVRDRHYKGIIATKGNTGLSYARHYKPDAIFLDMKLPIMDGADVLKRLKSDPELRHIPVQVISGYDRKKEGMELGAFDFVRKPVTNDGLVKTFDKIEAFVNNKLKKLLVVEDNENQNLAIRELIGNGDVKCFPAYSGMEAYEALGKEFFDCIIVDLGLPDMTGFELLEKIKINEQLNTIPVVVYTGKDLTREESLRLSKLANTVVLKTANSQERLLDETILFLHRVESRLPIEKQTIIRKLHKTDEVLRNKKVLVVDDDIRNIYSLTNALEEEGMLCFTADNGKAALDMIKEKAGIDIILMDVMMPEMDGYEATREIRSLSKFSKLPIIALTAKAMKGDKEKCLNAGMSDYIAKPVNIDQLLSLLRVWLYK